MAYAWKTEKETKNDSNFVYVLRLIILNRYGAVRWVNTK